METSILNQAWAVVVPLASASLLGDMRHEAGLEVLIEKDRVWLRGRKLDARLEQRLLCLPARERYSLAPAGTLTPWNHLVPTGTLPCGTWQPLATWCSLALPRAGFTGISPAPVTLTLVPSTHEQPAGALLTNWLTWAHYATAAPQARLNGLAFARNDAGQALIRGERLPPLPGERFTQSRGILTPCGYTWQPAVSAEVVRTVFGLADGECALWTATERWERIAADAWVKATRSSVRRTIEEVRDG